MIVFENDGEIDPRLISLIGVNVKDSASAIGYFGTGLKYAIAQICAWGEAIEVQSGEAVFRFEAERQIIRGKEFSVIVMRGARDSLPLGFTTELGKNWKPWMVYRELWCNAQDECGAEVYEAAARPMPTRGVTRVVVSGANIELAHAARAATILDRGGRGLLHTVADVEIFEGRSEVIFYRGIAVQGLVGKPSLYTYNILRQMYLTEDRTSPHWETDPIIAYALANLNDDEMIEAPLRAKPSEVMEGRLSYDYVVSGSRWQELAKQAVARAPLEIGRSVRKMFEGVESKCCPACGRPL